MIWGVALIEICAMDAKLKIIECTTCDDGIRKLRCNEVNYGLILGVSIILRGTPSLIRLIKKKKKASVQHGI